jgi:O-antigen/teichoic acid export membrane protein
MDTGRSRAIWIVGGRVALVVSSIVGVRLLTELLAPGEVGRMSLVLSVYQWFGFLFVSPVGLFVLRHANGWSNNGILLPNLRRMNAYFLTCALLTAVVVALVQSHFGLGVDMAPIWIAWLIGGHLLFVVLAGTNAACLNNLGRSFWFVALSNLAPWLGLLVAALLCVWLGGKTEFWLTGILAGYVTSSGLSFIVLRRASRHDQKRLSHRTTPSDVTKFSLRPLLAFAGPIVPITLAYWCQTDGFRFVLQRKAGATELGLFLVALTLGGTPILAAERLLVDLLSPDFYRRIASKDLATMKAAWTDYAGSLLPSMLVAVAFVSAAGPLLARVLVSDRFQSIGAFAAYGAMFRGVFAATSALLLWTHAVEKTSSPLPAYLLGAVVVFLGMYFFSPRSPLNGTGLTLVGSSLCTFGLLASTMKRRYGIVIPWRRLILGTAISLPLFAAAMPLAHLARGLDRFLVCVMIAPMALYCGVACALFSGLFGQDRRWKWAMAYLSRKRTGTDSPFEAETEIQSPPPLT